MEVIPVMELRKRCESLSNFKSLELFIIIALKENVNSVLSQGR